MRIPDPLQFPVQPNAQSAAAFMGTGESIPVLIVNTDANNTIYVGYRNQSKIGDPNTVPLAPGQSVIMDGARTLYVIGPTGTANATIIPGGTSFFQPTSLNTLGGVKVFIQASAPTQPPTIPVNSIWLQTSAGNVIAFSTWNGSAWVQQQFNAQGLLVIGTIVANLIAAGTVVAGIVDGTTIVGGVFRAKNSFGATILTINKSAGALLLYQDLGSATQGGLVFSAALASGTDEFSNPFGAGAKAYGTGGNTSFVQMLPGNPVFLNVATGDPAEATPGQIQARIIGNGATRFLSNDLRAAFVTGFPNAQAELQLFSVNAGGTTDAGVNLSATNPNATVSTLYHQTSTQFGLTGAPIIADRTIQVNDSLNTWGCDKTQFDATTITRTNPTVVTDITKTYTIKSADISVGSIFCIEIPFNGLWEASGNLNLQFDLNGTVTNLVPIAAGLAVAGHNYGGVFRLYLQVNTTGAAGTFTVWGDGGVTDTSVNRAGATSADLFGITTGTINTTVDNTLAIAVNFSVSNVNQTISSRGSRMTKYGL